MKIREIENSLGYFIFVEGNLLDNGDFRQITYSKLILEDTWNICIENDKGRVREQFKII